MNNLAWLYLTCIVAGYALTLIEPVSFINAGVTVFFQVIGYAAMIVFSLATIVQGARALLGKL